MTNTEKDIKALDKAIDAMNRIGRVMAYCREATKYPPSDDYEGGTIDACRDIIKILEEGTK